MDYEGIIEDIGGFGHWQRVIFTLISLPDIPIALALLLPVFVGSVPNWGCGQEAINQTNYNSRNTTQYNTSVETYVLNGDEAQSFCERCDQHQFNDTFTTIVDEWDLVCDKDYISDLISSIQLAGPIIGAILFSQISDVFGRKKAHFSSIFILGLAGLLSAFSSSWQMFAVLRLAVGICHGGFASVNCVYPMEFISKRWRTLCGSLGFWPVGQMLLALLAYFIRDWRYLTATSACVAFPYVLFWWLLPESPRWLLQRGRTAEAKAVFSNIAIKNRKPVPNMDFLNGICQETDRTPRHNYTYLDLFSQKIILRRTVACSSLWFTFLLAYTEISYNVKNLSGDRYLNVVYGALFDLTGLIAVVMFNNILGRRICLVTTLVLQTAINASLVVIHVSNKEEQLDSTVTWLALVGKGVGNTSLYLVQIYAAELFPTDVRNLGVGAAATVGRIGSLLGPQVLYLGTKIKVFPFALISGLCAAVIPLCLLLPETSGQPLVDDFNFRTKPEHIDLKSEDG